MMPQVTVQCPRALVAGFDGTGFALALHAGASALIDSPVEGFKTRFVDPGRTVVGDGDARRQMLHVLVEIRSGRPAMTRSRLVDLVLALLGDHLDVPRGLVVQATAEVRELETYRQVVLP